MESKPGSVLRPAAGLVGTAAVLTLVSPWLLLLIFLPLSLLVLALGPRRPVLLVAALCLIVVALAGAETARETFWYLERGWALLLGAWFIVMALVLPQARFFPRALAAVGAAAATAATLLLVQPGGWQALDTAVSTRYQEAAEYMITVWSQSEASQDRVDQATTVLRRAAELQSYLHPAMLALESLVALTVVWWGYGRVIARERAPLGRLRDFRFSDHLVWLLIAGLLLMIVQKGEPLTRAGANLVTFMGALYALRGGAILLVFTGLQGVRGALLAAGISLLFYPIVLTTTILVGLSDTWFDLRARRAAARPDS